MANVFYLDVDDEITSAAARIRSSQDPRVGLVVPPGSRIATSRINFRLLAREALERNRGLSIVSSDPAARALAASAGLPVYATVAEFEADQGAVHPAIVPEAAPSTQKSGQPKAGAKGGTKSVNRGGATNAGQMAAFGEAAVATAPAPGGLRSAGDARIGARSSGAAAPAVRAATRTSRASARVAAGIVTVLIMVLVLGLIGVFLLPSATITVSPKLEAVGPIQLSIRADPNATSSDPVAGVVPAVVLTMDFTATGTFNATGTKVNTTPASGTVTFTNNDTGNGVTIPSGSKVGTESGIMFTTTQDVTVPRARFKPSFRPGTASVGVTAATAGTAGNVPAGSIDQVPAGYSGILLNVTNPAATSGGTKTTTTQIQKKDTDAAMAGLTKNLKAQYTSWLAAPGGLAPGSTAFPKTGLLGVITPDNDPASLIGVTQATFDLTLTASGSETAVDQSSVSSLAAARIDSTVPTEFTLVAGSEKVTIGTPRNDGAAIVFPVTATASQVRQLDPDTLRQQVLGKSVDEARAILAQDGTVDIQTWPGFVGTIPSLAWRLTLTVDTSGITASPGPAASPNGATDLPSAGPSSGPSSLPSAGPSGTISGPGRSNG